MPLSKETQNKIEKYFYKNRITFGGINAGNYLEESDFIAYATKEAERVQILEEALKQIQEMKLLPGEVDYKYAFNRCWHIANDALNNNLK